MKVRSKPGFMREVLSGSQGVKSPDNFPTAILPRFLALTSDCVELTEKIFEARPSKRTVFSSFSLVGKKLKPVT